MRVHWLAVSLCAICGCGRVGFVERALEDGAVPPGDGSNLPPGDGATTDAGTSDALAACTGANRCTIDATKNGTYCGGAFQIVNGEGAGTIDMAASTELVLSATLCNPTGYTIHLADSPSCNGGGGDAAQFSNDAEVYLQDTAIFAFSNDLAPMAPALLGDDPGMLSLTGCQLFTMRVADKEIHVSSPKPFDLVSDFALRLNPPSDAEGPPDALWYLGIDRTTGSAARNGTGVTTVDLCW
ncbi:MAG TPA: hypothetical protein VFQ53_36170 [Kofleriaceae bacterium]|nr:hypothetical protein [Kofleriaceae bacterium]